MCDVNDSLAAAEKLAEKDKRDYMYSVGIDIDRVRAYYHTVVYIERMFRMTLRKP